MSTPVRRPSWENTCSLRTLQCGSTRFWTSRTGYQVCYACTHGDPLAGLIVLARRSGSEAVARAQGWAQEGGADEIKQARPHEATHEIRVDAEAAEEGQGASGGTLARVSCSTRTVEASSSVDNAEWIA
jgi:hypothetical protein